MQSTNRNEDEVGIRFNKMELVREVKALGKIARRFLDGSTVWALHELESALTATSVGTVGRIELRQLRTRPNDGAHEPGDRRGALSVYAGITGCWELRLEDNVIEFCGLSSTKVELFNAEGDERVAMWRVELGADDAPGCYFHVQVLGDREEAPFPHALPVPRLPTIFVTPMAATEYVLGELFQTQWEEAVSRRHPDEDYWRGLQARRLRCLLSWQERELGKRVQSSPWMILKAAKPCPNIFLDEAQQRDLERVRRRRR